MSINILFVCIHDGARSQMAEAFANQSGGGRVKAVSAGLEPGLLNPMVVACMQEVGIDISGETTTSVADVLQSGRRFAYVVTICDEVSAARSPAFPRSARRLHWSFPDPSALSGSMEERLAGTRIIRDEIRRTVSAWCATFSASS